MSITDELREFTKNYVYFKAEVTAIADRIDAEHKAALLNVHTDLMDASGWVRLPKDADGEYIHIGDRMENNERVVRIVLTDESWEPSVYLEKLPNVLHEYFCNEISHYHAPTVEDVLREFAEHWNDPAHYAKGELVEQYAAKLRLAGEDI